MCIETACYWKGALCCPHSLFNEIITYSNSGSLHVLRKHRKEIFASERWSVWIILYKKLNQNSPFIPVTFIFHIYYFIISSSAGEVTGCKLCDQTVFCSRARYFYYLEGLARLLFSLCYTSLRDGKACRKWWWPQMFYMEVHSLCPRPLFLCTCRGW